MPRRSEPHSPSATPAPDVVGCSAGGSVKSYRARHKRQENPSREREGRRPEERWAPTQGLAFRYLTRYIFDTDRLLPQLEVVDGRAGLPLLHVGDRSWWYFCFLSFESMFERNYLILPVSSSCLFFLRVSCLYGGTR